ncbi:MAG TPA: DNA translocase FtsK, partial [Pirellulales bacterium]|nr:DNA translocase FtsK [Pirellulales bacterium]
GTYVSDDEINKVVEFVGTTEPEFVKELVQLKPADSAEGGPDRFKKRDELYESAIEVIIREGRGSVSLLQRALGVGYGRGARLIDFMAEDGIVGAYNGSQAREVLVTMDQWLEMSGQAAGTTQAPAKRPSNKIRPEPEADEPTGKPALASASGSLALETDDEADSYDEDFEEGNALDGDRDDSDDESDGGDEFDDDWTDED